MKLIQYVFSNLDLRDFRARVGTRDPESDKYVGDAAVWEQATNAIIEACERLGLNYTVEAGEAAFYGPKLDFIFRDVLKREWQLGTFQLDYNLPERFELEYVGEDNERHRPVMIHRAPFGSLERFIGILIEHYNGAFPAWLAPVQAVLIPIADRHTEYARDVAAQLRAEGAARRGRYLATHGRQDPRGVADAHPVAAGRGRPRHRERRQRALALRGGLGAMHVTEFIAQASTSWRTSWANWPNAPRPS